MYKIRIKYVPRQNEKNANGATGYNITKNESTSR